VSETLQQIRFLALYPAMATSGLFWAAVFWLRFRRGRCIGDFWAGTLALALAGYALMSIGALWIASSTGFGQTTASLYTLGILAPTLALVCGSAVMLVRGWRR